jgi:hypothetical protein
MLQQNFQQHWGHVTFMCVRFVKLDGNTVQTNKNAFLKLGGKVECYSEWRGCLMWTEVEFCCI